MAVFEKFIEIANEEIAKAKFIKNPQGLYDPINYTMSLGGKRLRPALMMMCCEAFGSHYTMCLNQAIGLELFHNFTLLHDDVMDKADMRRNNPTVHKKWNTNTAILSGDTMLTLAYQFMLERKHGAKNSNLLSLFNNTAIEIYEGQQYDMEFEKRNDVTVDEYIEMIRLKTSVLFGCALRMGALLAGAHVKDQNYIYKFGEYLGLAFQLQDDYLDVYGNPETFGKQIGGDILNGKKTFMLISAYNAANDEQKEKLKELILINDPARNEEKIKGVTELYNELNIPELCKKKIEEYLVLSRKALDKIKFEKADKDEFLKVIDFFMNRKK